MGGDGPKINPGHCPEPKGTMLKRGEKLVPQKLAGLWKFIYEEKRRTDGLDCFSMRIDKDFAGANATQFQVTIGHGMADPSDPTILFEDDQYFTFNHPTESTRAAV